MRDAYYSTARVTPAWAADDSVHLITSPQELAQRFSSIEGALYLDLDSLEEEAISQVMALLTSSDGQELELVLVSEGALVARAEALRRAYPRCSGLFSGRQAHVQARATPPSLTRTSSRQATPRQRSAVPSIRALFTSRYRSNDLIVESTRMRETLSLAQRAAKSDASVLIHGESGTGKERIARYIHDQSARAEGPFVAVNCKAFSESVLESELFGHRQGAFTGASQDRVGVFERAIGGTIFLDEIGEVGLEFQAKLLRVLQEKEVLPVGGARPIHCDVRVVTATNRALQDEVREGRFRQDLLYRICVIPIEVPPLRERRSELLTLANHFIQRYNHKMDRHIEGWSDEVEAFLLAHPWPGNVRELENAIERACVMARGERLTIDDLMLDDALLRNARLSNEARPEARSLQEVVDEATRAHLLEVLAEVRWNRGEAASRLGVDRTTLYRLMKKLELS